MSCWRWSHSGAEETGQRDADVGEGGDGDGADDGGDGTFVRPWRVGAFHEAVLCAEERRSETRVADPVPGRGGPALRMALEDHGSGRNPVNSSSAIRRPDRAR